MDTLQAIFDIWKGTLTFADLYGGILRYVFPILALIVLSRCVHSLLFFQREPEVWAWLIAPDGTKMPITHWETLLGRAKSCDVVLDYPTISRNHAVLTRYDDGSWTISDIGSMGGIQVNGVETAMQTLEEGDGITLGGVPFSLEPITRRQEAIQASVRTRAGGDIRPGITLFFLSLFQILTALQLMLHDENPILICRSFGILMVLQWGLFALMKLIKRTGFEMETIAFFLCTLGLAVIGSTNPAELTKQLVCISAGLIVFLFLCWSLRNLERAKTMRYLAAAGGLGLLAFNLVFGVEQYGARNWIFIGGISFQPSELVKLCFLFTGASTLQRVMTKRNMFLFIGYSAVICGCLVLMNDFGTALIFFVAFLVIAFMRSGSFATVALALSATGFAGVLAVKFKPHILNRFSAWGHVWENALTTGYQQTRALMCIASGGLFGLGVGQGWLKYVGAADTDLVFGLVSEEWGLLIAILMVLAVASLAVFAVRISADGRSSFYTIGACAAAAILLLQTILNVFGTVDILPLTGVTFPYVSNGGSSMISCWGLLAFIKAADIRQNASFAVKLPSKKHLQDSTSEGV